MLTIVSHDAGGAEILSSFALNYKNEVSYVLDGPAIQIFNRKLGEIEIQDLENAISNADWVLTGTSWASIIELNAIDIARKYNKKVISYLDHWGNYNERFQRDNKSILPDEIWVGDQYAFELANNLFFGLKIVEQINPYIVDIKNSLSQFECVNVDQQILYVCEPIREHALLKFGNERHWGYTEEDALRWFLNNSHKEFNYKTIKIRPHPSEKPDKYNWAIEEYENVIEISKNTTLLEDIAGSFMVVGCESMAMVVGLIAGKRVLCSIPPGGRPCSLPHREIENLQQILEARN